MPIIKATGITKIYGSGPAEVHALWGIDFAAEPGEFVAVMGPSGSGKSTLLSILGGLESATYGQVWLDGQALGGLPESELAVIRREKVGFVFQAFNLVPELTAEENIAVPLLLAGRRGAAVREPVERLLELAGLSDRRHHRPAELSGGQQQRVAIARALVMDPLVVLADEPTGNLDSRTGAEIMSLLRRSCDEKQQTFVVITHDESVAAWADRVVHLSDGVLLEGAAAHA